jgi:HK97 family phage major capsid protein
MSELEKVLKAQEDLGKTFHAFKEKNDERIAELEKKGTVDALLKEQVDRINTDLSEISASVDEFVKKQQRPGVGGDEKAETDLRAQAAEFFTIANKSIVSPKDVNVEEYQDYLNTFNTYLRKGDKGSGVQNALSVGSDPEGGYFVPATMSANIVKRIFETSEMRGIASVVSIGTDALEYPLDTNEGTSGGWVAEKQTRSETNTPEVGTGRIPVHEQYAEPKVTQKLLDDAQINIESWLVDKTVDKMVRTENAAFITGDGVGKPRGFLDYKTTALTTKDSSRVWGKLQYKATGVSGGFGGTGSPTQHDVNALIDLIHAMKPQYRAGSGWVANRLTLAEARKLKDADGNYLWQMGNIQVGQPATLLGFGISEMEDMPDIAADSYSMAFANFREGYQIVDRQGVRLLRDPFTAKPFVKFYITKRVGGDVTNFDAIKLLKFGTS